MTVDEAAAIIDPPAFAAGSLITDQVRAVRQARARGKAGQILDEALLKDAARYRWLRDGNAYVPEEQCVTGDEALDHLVDEYIAAGVNHPWDQQER